MSAVRSRFPAVPGLGTLAESWDGTSWPEPSTPGPDLHSYLLAVAGQH